MNRKTLQRCRNLRGEADQLEQELGRLEAIMTAPKVQSLTGMPRGAAPVGSAVERMAIRHAELVDYYFDLWNDILSLQMSIEKAITALDPLERQLIRAYYIEGLSWEEISKQACYSRRHVGRIHAEAINKLEKEEAGL